MSHLDHRELVAWWERAAGERKRIVEHLAECRECASRYAELVLDAPSGGEPTVLRPERFRDRGYRIGTRTGAWRSPRLRWALAAAAVLVLALVLPSQWRAIEERSERSGVLRGETLVASSPRGDLSRPIPFAWTGAPRASRFVVDVYDEDRRLVVSVEVADAGEAGAAVEPNLEPGRRYAWMVTALDPSGGVVSTSPLVSFRIVAD